MKGYLKNPAATEAAFKGGWFHTGDLAVRHPDGYIEIKDRSKDIIIVGADNVSSLEIEEVLYRHPQIMEAAVVAKPDPVWGEVPCAFVALKPDVNPVPAVDIIAWCRANLAQFKVPRCVVFGPLPKTSTGKIQKFELRERAKEIAPEPHDSAHSPIRRQLDRGVGWGPMTTTSLMWAAFLVAFALAAIMLLIFGVGERGTAIALRATARWSFVLFWLAYAGGAIAWLCQPRLSRLARRGRDLGLAYASAQLIHMGLVLWIIHVTPGPSGAMVFFWIGIFCTYLLALFSLPRLRAALEPRLWRILRMIALEYIAIAFAADFITLHWHELGRHPLSYLPFALMLVSGAGLRFVAFWDRRTRLLGEKPSLRVAGRPPLFQFGRSSREDHLVVWPALIFVAAIVVLLALDDSLRMTFESVLALYGPLAAVLSGYVLFKSVARGVSLSAWR